jgi:hypothetical protein
LDPFLASMIYNTPASQKLKCTNKLKELHWDPNAYKYKMWKSYKDQVKN